MAGECRQDTSVRTESWLLDAGYLISSNPNRFDFASVSDVVKWVGAENDEVCPFAGG